MRPGPRRALRGDGQGVSEVIGYLLVFGILSIVLVLSMAAFATGQEAAQARAVQLRAESAAARVAGVVVQAAILAEQQGTSAALAYGVDLPEQFEGRDYTVRLEGRVPPNCTTNCITPDLVRVKVPSLSINVTAPVFSVSAPANIAICTTTEEVPGGPLYVRIYGANAQPSATGPFKTHPPCVANELFLEET